MIFVKSAHQAEISIVAASGKALRVQGAVGHTTVNFTVQSPEAAKSMLRLLDHEHKAVTGEPLTVFDMSERVAGL